MSEDFQSNEAISSRENPYSHSVLISKLKERQARGEDLKIAFLDIDSTITGNHQDTLELRNCLEDKGYAVVFVTTRTEEMVMSEEQYQQSVEKYGFDRDYVKFGRDETGKKIYTPTSELIAKGKMEMYIQDPDVIIGSTGGAIWVGQEGGGYQSDTAYQERMEIDPKEWHKEVLQLLYAAHYPMGKDSPSASEWPARYHSGRTDVMPPTYRVQVNFKTEQEKKDLAANLRALENTDLDERLQDRLASLRITDNSNPQHGRYALYLSPAESSKLLAVEQVTTSVCEELGVDRQDLHTLVSGDSFADFSMCLLGATGTDSTFVLPSQSRLTAIFTYPSVTSFAGEDLTKVKACIRKESDDVYVYSDPDLGTERRIIIGDVRSPQANAPRSLLDYLSTEK